MNDALNWIGVVLGNCFIGLLLVAIGVVAVLIVRAGTRPRAPREEAAPEEARPPVELTDPISVEPGRAREVDLAAVLLEDAETVGALVQGPPVNDVDALADLAGSGDVLSTRLQTGLEFDTRSELRAHPDHAVEGALDTPAPDTPVEAEEPLADAVRDDRPADTVISDASTIARPIGPQPEPTTAAGDLQPVSEVEAPDSVSQIGSDTGQRPPASPAGSTAAARRDALRDISSELESPQHNPPLEPPDDERLAPPLPGTSEAREDALIEELGLSVRAHYSFRHVGITKISQVVSLTNEELLAVPNLGLHTLIEIRSKLEEYLAGASAREPRLQPLDAGSDTRPEPPAGPAGSAATAQPEPLPDVSPDTESPQCGVTAEPPADVRPAPPAPSASQACEDALIDELGLSTRAYNSLMRTGITRISQVESVSDQHLMAIPMLGLGEVIEIKGKLARYLAGASPQQPALRQTYSTAPAIAPSIASEPEPMTAQGDLQPASQEDEATGSVPQIGSETRQELPVSPAPSAAARQRDEVSDISPAPDSSQREPLGEPPADERPAHSAPSATAEGGGASIDRLGLSEQAYDSLERAGITKISQVTPLTTEELLAIPNLGLSTLIEIQRKLAVYLAGASAREPALQQTYLMAPDIAPSTRTEPEPTPAPADLQPAYEVEAPESVPQIGSDTEQEPPASPAGSTSTVQADVVQGVSTDSQSPQHRPPVEPPVDERPAPAQPSTSEAREDALIDELGLSVRAYDCLRRAGTTKISQVASLSDPQLIAIPILGLDKVIEIKRKLARYLAGASALEPALRESHSAPPTTAPPTGAEAEPTSPRGDLQSVFGVEAPDSIPQIGSDTGREPPVGPAASTATAQRDALPEISPEFESQGTQHMPEPSVGERPAPAPTRASAVDEDVPIDKLGLSVRAYNSLRHVGITTILQVTPLTDEELLAIPNLGEGTLDEIRRKLAEYLAKASAAEPPLQQAVSAAPAIAESIRAAPRPVPEVETPNPVPQIGSETGRDLPVSLEPSAASGRRIASPEVPPKPDSPQLELLGQPSSDERPAAPMPSATAAGGGALIHELRLSEQAYDSLEQAGITRVSQVASLSDQQLMAIPMLGLGEVIEIKGKLAEYLDRASARGAARQQVASPRSVIETPLPPPPARSAEEPEEPVTEARPDPDVAESAPPPPPASTTAGPAVKHPRTREVAYVSPAPPRHQILGLGEAEVAAVPPTASSTLEEWELYLMSETARVELLGEIPLGDEERATLGRLVGARIRGCGRNTAEAILEMAFPSTFATFLVAQGVYGYDGVGGYWPGVSGALGRHLDAGWCNRFGRLFERVLDAKELPLFPDLGGRRFVDLILCHGGIPNYCLADFFANMLQPAVTRARYAGMSAGELIDDWLWHSSGRYFTDKPVLRFLQFGGDVSEDFVDRCLEMAAAYQDSGIVPAADEAGLPARVVEAYERWVSEQGVDQVRREGADRWRPRKPRVLVDPWGEGVYVDLPPQQVPATVLHAGISWSVRMGPELRSIPVSVRRIGFDRRTEAASLPLSEPAGAYEVSLQVDGESKRTWRYQGATDAVAMLAFDPDTGALVERKPSLPARPLMVLYPAGLHLQVIGEARLLETLPSFPWGWADFRGEMWDLSQASELVLRDGGEIACSIVLRPVATTARPELVGGNPLLPGAARTQIPLYVGMPPSIRVPLAGRTTVAQELGIWQLMLRNRWAAAPELTTRLSLKETRSDLVLAEGHVDLPLGTPQLLGDAPFGNYQVRVRGPLGRGAPLALRIVPHLAVDGDEKLHIPAPQDGPSPALLTVETAAGDYVECQGETDQCLAHLVDESTEARKHYIVAAPDATEVEMTVVRPQDSGDSIRVPFSVPIRRLRWALLGGSPEVDRTAWTGRPLRRPVESLLQGISPLLLVNLPLHKTEQAGLRLRLIDVDGRVLQVLDPVARQRGQTLWRFELAAFLDTVRACRSPVIRAQLEIWGLPGRDDAPQLPVLSLTQSLTVDHITLDGEHVVEGMRLDLGWREEVRLRNRQVRLWPLWRPWDTEILEEIPDQADGKHAFTVQTEGADLGRCRVEFLVVDPWAPDEERHRPSKGTPSTADIALTPAETRLSYLEGRHKKRGPSFELQLERAFILHEEGDSRSAQPPCQWCFDNLDSGTIPQVLALVGLLESRSDADILLALRLRMFSPLRVKRLLDGAGAGTVSADCLRAYLAQLPGSGKLPQATWRQLLSADDEPVRLNAVQQLVRAQDAAGVDAILDWVEAATLSDADAVGMLQLAPEFSADRLEERLSRPVALRLLEALAVEMGDRTPVVRPGTWIYTEAGWGRIERIETLDGQAVQQYIYKQADHRLFVTLRPAVDAEPIEVNLKRKLISFPHADRIFTCAKCKGCSARDQYLIVERHDGVAHGGLGPSYRPERVTERSLRTIEYRRRAPPKGGLGSEPME